MAVTKIDIISNTKFMIIGLLAIVLQVSFFIIPACWIQDSTRTIKLDGCAIDKIQGSTTPVCNETYKLLDPTNNTEMPRHTILFQLPYIEYGLRPHCTKWRSKWIGYLSICMKKKVASSVFKEWKVNLLVNHGAYTSATTYDNSTVRMAWYNSSDSLNTDHQDTYNYTVPLLDFIPLPGNAYTVAVHSPLLETHGPEMCGMTIALTMGSDDFIEFMVYPKMIFFGIGVVLIMWFTIYFFKRPNDDTIKNVAIWQLGFFLIIVDIPLEWLDLQLDFTYLLTVKDYWIDLYYLAFEIFSLLFIYEQFIVKLHRNKLQKTTFPIISYYAIWIGSIILICFHAYQNLMEIQHPFFNLELTGWRRILVLSFIVLLPVMAFTYINYLLILILKALFVATASSKRGPTGAGLFQRDRRSQYVLMATLICACFTLVEFSVHEIFRNQTQWNDGKHIMHYLTALSVGVFAMWNIFTLLILYLYIPAHGHKSTSPLPSYDECMSIINPNESTEFDAESQEKK